MTLIQTNVEGFKDLSNPFFKHFIGDSFEESLPVESQDLVSSKEKGEVLITEETEKEPSTIEKANNYFISNIGDSFEESLPVESQDFVSIKEKGEALITENSEEGTSLKRVKAYCKNTENRIKTWYGNLSPKSKLLIGAGAVCVVAGFFYQTQVKQETHPLSEVLDGKTFLVNHDNKPKGDKKEGRLLARLGVINAKDGYRPVHIKPGSLLAESSDLESLLVLPNKNYLTCESGGKCFEFKLEKDATQGYRAEVVNTLKLEIPNATYINIEGVAIHAGHIFWSHRGDPNMFDKSPDAKKAPYLNQIFSAPFQEGVTSYKPVSTITTESAFTEVRPELRSRGDHFITQKREHLFIAASDPEEIGSTDAPESILHNGLVSIFRFVGDKIEAIYQDATRENTIYLGTDNEAAGASICKLSLDTLEHRCALVRKGQEFGISGMVEMK